MGQVRAVLWHHLAAHSPHVPSPPEGDPNELLDAAPFVSALDELRLQRGDEALREAGISYAALWARTFRTLVRHLRGHPGHALQLWSHDVYPYLRGDMLAARAEKTGGQDFEVLVHDDLPGAYVAGLLQGFLELVHADADVQVRGGGRLRIHYRLRPTEQVVRLAYMTAQLRIPLLLTSLLAALVGILFAWQQQGATSPWVVLATVGGALAAQSGANAFHDLAESRPRPMSAPGPPRNWLLFQAVGSYTVAATAMVTIMAMGHPAIVVYASLGLLLGLMYRGLRDQGWGPLIAAISHGPLSVWGAYHALAGTSLIEAPTTALLLALPSGLMAAAILYLDDLADRPLDEAAGKRTLVVRLPRRRHMIVFGALLVSGIAATTAVVAGYDLRWLFAAFVVALASGLLLVSVRRNLDDPHGLAPARMGMLAVFVAALALVIAALAGGPA